MIRQVHRYIFVGSDADLPLLKTQPPILHAAKEPFHRHFVGYDTPGAPKDDEEYLVAIRDRELAINLIDGDDPKFVPLEMIDSAVNFVNYYRCKNTKVFIHCNQGLSRAPTIAMLVMAPSLHADYGKSLLMFREVFPEYAPRNGIQQFAELNWDYFHGERL